MGLRANWQGAIAESEYRVRSGTGTLWGYMKQRGNPCFNLGC
jgi:hypothetical protein